MGSFTSSFQIPQVILRVLVAIYGDNLNSDLLGITQRLENICMEYFRLPIHTPLENIRYNNFKVISSNFTDEIQPYISDQET